ncbi:MAG: phospholipase D-like domain-containing protein, partial [Lachnospira sp.]|nr:phospholipase D-like domain-containing protein [Lachnospira sp.]
PLGEERIGENVYLNIAKNAKKYLYIMTPYLIITDEMGRELSLAAKRGVDVRLITPGIPDKKIVYQMTRSYYAGLVRNGVRIYEYTPGFCHAKQWVSDGEVATVGTINMDFRGLYLHFENGVFIYKDEIIKDIEDDFAKTMAECRDVTDKYYSDRSRPLRIGQCILRLFAPLV